MLLRIVIAGSSVSLTTGRIRPWSNEHPDCEILTATLAICLSLQYLFSESFVFDVYVIDLHDE